MIMYVIEGIRGCGKDTLQTNLKNVLVGMGKHVAETRDPGSTSLGDSIYDTLHVRKPFKVSDFAAGFLYLAARAEMIEELTAAVEEDLIVLQNRWTPSTIAYQRKYFHAMARELDAELPVKRVFWINTPPDIALARMRRRNDNKPLKLEDFQHQQYFDMCMSESKWVELDGMLSPELLTEQAMQTIQGDLHEV